LWSNKHFLSHQEIFTQNNPILFIKASTSLLSIDLTKQIMVRFTAVVLVAAPAVTAFAPTSHSHPRVGRLAAAPQYTDDFDAPILANPKSASPLDHVPVVDNDECYLGKYGQYDECVDFGESQVFLMQMRFKKIST
jgi:hypothetical protein